ncbi:MAG TPA: hypothetical protein VGG20_14815 [Thermoanaerobaculia bacterium]|jgi:hypothetical protein
MTRDDYEDQKHRLAEQRRLRVELAESTYQQQMRALDLVWGMMSGEGSADLLSPPLPGPSFPAAVAPAAPARRRLGPGELYDSIVEVLAGLPDPFIYSDVYQAIGYEPDRGSLHRVLKELKDEGDVVIHRPGRGSAPMQFRWARARAAGAVP